MQHISYVAQNSYCDLCKRHNSFVYMCPYYLCLHIFNHFIITLAVFFLKQFLAQQFYLLISGCSIKKNLLRRVFHSNSLSPLNRMNNTKYIQIYIKKNYTGIFHVTFNPVLWHNVLFFKLLKHLQTHIMNGLRPAISDTRGSLHTLLIEKTLLCVVYRATRCQSLMNHFYSLVLRFYAPKLSHSWTFQIFH